MAFKGPGMGIVIGAGLSGGTAAAVRAFTTYDKWATLIGMGAGALVGFGLTMSGGKWKAIGWDALWGAILTGAPRAIEELVVGGGLSGAYEYQQLGQGVQVLGLTTATEQTYGTANIGGSFGAVPIAGMQ